jgi:hypothetical protein
MASNNASDLARTFGPMADNLITPTHPAAFFGSLVSTAGDVLGRSFDGSYRRAQMLKAIRVHSGAASDPIAHVDLPRLTIRRVRRRGPGAGPEVGRPGRR